MYANLLKYSSVSSRHLNRQSTMHSKKAPHAPLSLSALALSTMALSVWIIATKRLPKQIEPNEVVVARTKLSLMATEQHDPASSGANHHLKRQAMSVSFSYIARDITSSEQKINKRNLPTYVDTTPAIVT